MTRHSHDEISLDHRRIAAHLSFDLDGVLRRRVCAEWRELAKLVDTLKS
jgi:hypothetical protein